MYQEELGRQLPSGNAKAVGLASSSGGGIPEADSDADGVGAVAQSNRMGSSNSQPFGGGCNGYSSKLINTKRQCDRMISHAVFPICLSLGLRPWGLGLGRWRGERARACGVYRQQLTSPARFSTKCASLTPGMDIGVNGHGGINWQGSI
jgi:hypothetical protein